jgi:aminoglycoside phosphotransferase (APT) family kinase protein
MRQHQPSALPAFDQAAAVEVVKAVPFWDSCGGVASIEKLCGGQQNANFKVVTTSAETFVCRVPGIDAAEHGQAHQTVFDNACAAHAVMGVAPQPRWFDAASGVMVTDFVDGQVLTMASLKEPAILEAVVATVRRGHKNSTAAGTEESTDKCTEKVSVLAASQASDFLFGYSLDLLAGWHHRQGDEGILAAEDLEAIRSLQQLLHTSLGKVEPLVNCHNDLCLENILLLRGDDGPRIRIIDWEWAGPGDPLCDLATFCALSKQDDAGEFAVLALYRGLQTTSESSSEVDSARLRLWRTWFALRGALWARKKAVSPHFANGRTGPDDDYHSFAEEGIAEFLRLFRGPSTAKQVEVLTKAVLGCL